MYTRRQKKKGIWGEVERDGERWRGGTISRGLERDAERVGKRDGGVERGSERDGEIGRAHV